jgi:SH3 domain protein
MEVIRIRKIKFIFLFALLIPLSVSVGSTHADTRYVSDMLILTLREGQGPQYKIIRTLKTGTPIEVLEESTRYLRVRTQEGEEGWVEKQYISPEEPKAVILAGLKKETNRLKARVEELEIDQAALLDQLNAAKQSHTAKVKEASRLNMELRQITEKYSALLDKSGNVAELIKENDLLYRENERLQAANDRLNTEAKHPQQEIARLRRTEMLWLFLAGAGVFFVGLIVGKISKKKRYYFDV